MTQNKEKLWFCVMKDKYVKNGDFFTATIPSNASWGWRSIIKGRAVIEGGASWRVGDGKSLSFWADWWVGKKPLGLDMEIDIAKGNSNAKISDFLLQNNSWDITKLQEYLSEEQVEMIQAIPIASEEGATDSLWWQHTPVGNFSVKTIYDLIAGNDDRMEEDAWVWKLDCLEKHKAFMWLMVKDQILTNVKRKRRRLTGDALCLRCVDEEEIVDHLFRSCSVARSYWRKF